MTAFISGALNPWSDSRLYSAFGNRPNIHGGGKSSLRGSIKCAFARAKGRRGYYISPAINYHKSL